MRNNNIIPTFHMRTWAQKSQWICPILAFPIVTELCLSCVLITIQSCLSKEVTLVF